MGGSCSDFAKSLIYIRWWLNVNHKNICLSQHQYFKLHPDLNRWNKKNYGSYFILPLKLAEFQHSKDQLIDTYRAEMRITYLLSIFNVFFSPFWTQTPGQPPIQVFLHALLSILFSYLKNVEYQQWLSVVYCQLLYEAILVEWEDPRAYSSIYCAALGFCLNVCDW